MNTLRTLARMRHAVYGNAGMGVIVTVAGLIQATVPLMYLGICWILGSVTVLVLTYLAVRGEAEMTIHVTGEIVERQQPQLPHVQAHMHCTPELPQAA
jgi:hypothetical protein